MIAANAPSDAVSTSRAFTCYVSDNWQSLSGLGIIASVAALFLSLDPTVFANGLREIQLLLLLFLALSVIFVSFDTFWWTVKKADSFFGGLVVTTLVIFFYRLCQFISGNFTNELKSYLAFISISVTFIILFFLWDLYKKLEKIIDNKTTKYRPLLFGLLIFCFFYLYRLGTNLYSDLSHNLSIEHVDLIAPLDTSLVGFSIWFGVITLAMENIDLKRNPRGWTIILFSPALAFAFYFSVQLFFAFRVI